MVVWPGHGSLFSHITSLTVWPDTLYSWRPEIYALYIKLKFVLVEITKAKYLSLLSETQVESVPKNQTPEHSGGKVVKNMSCDSRSSTNYISLK